MVSTVNTGSVNMPQILRQMSHRTNNVRDLLFQRDAVYDKDFAKFRKDDDSAAELSGPPVHFGYETSSTTNSTFTKTQDSGTITHRYSSTPQLTIGGLKALQTPVISRSGKLERTGHRITGACKFYLPSLDYIRSLDSFNQVSQFDEIETYDKLIDIERVIIRADIEGDDLKLGLGGYHTYSAKGGWQGKGYLVDGGIRENVDDGGPVTAKISSVIQFESGTSAHPPLPHYAPGYECDRVQFEVKSAGTLDYVQIEGYNDGNDAILKWDCNMDLRSLDADGDALSTNEWTLIDLPLRDIESADTTIIYKEGIADTFTASKGSGDVIANFDKMLGMAHDGSDRHSDNSNNYLKKIRIQFTEAVTHEIRNLKLYKAAEWHVESIKDYRDEYLQVDAVRVRGDRTSRRRAYG